MSVNIGAVSGLNAPVVVAPRQAPPAAAASTGKSLGQRIHLNPYIERYFLKLKQDPGYLPVTLAVENVILHQGDLAALHQAARSAAATRLRQELGREPRRAEVLERAYNAAAAAVIARPYQVPGIDELNHYFVSAAIASRAYKKLSYVPIPDRLRERSAVTMAMSAGYLKEFLDIPTSGFDRHDLALDRKGAGSPFSLP